MKRSQARPNKTSSHLDAVTAVAVILIAGTLSCSCSSQLAQDPISRSDAQALESFPHALFDETAQKYVDGAGRVDYTALKDDRAKLDQYVSTVATVGPKAYPKLFPAMEDKIAFYINAYNSLAMANVLSRYPGLTNVGDIKTEFFYLTNIIVGGEETDLYSFENEIVRPALRKHYVGKGEGAKFGRVHFALNCASASCPKLPDTAFLPGEVEAQLERETKKFVMEERNVTINATSKKVTLSRIFDWYADDFCDDKGKVINQLEWINLYRPEGQKVDASFEIAFHEYDWKLNDQKLYGGPVPKEKPAEAPAPAAKSAPAEAAPADAPASAPADAPAEAAPAAKP